MAEVRDGAGSLVAGYSYDNLGRRTGITRGNDASVSALDLTFA